MGTFIIRPTSLNQGGIPLTDTNNIITPTLHGYYIDFTQTPTLLSAIISSTVVGAVQAAVTTLAAGDYFSDTVSLGCSGASIYLDGSNTPIDEQHLQPGFTPISATIKMDNLTIQQPAFGGQTQFFIQTNGQDSGVLNANNYVYSSIPPMSTILFNSMGIRINMSVPGANDGASVLFNNLRIEGTYGILHNTGITVTGPTPINIGDPLTINTVGGTNIATVTGVIITYIDTGNVPHTVPIPFTVVNPTTIIATVPNYDGTPVITVNITGTIFTGVVPIGVFPTINFTDGSGIYQLVEGKLTDSAYAHGFNPIQIAELAIPNPFVKTGFIP